MKSTHQYTVVCVMNERHTCDNRQRGSRVAFSANIQTQMSCSRPESLEGLSVTDMSTTVVKALNNLDLLAAWTYPLLLQFHFIHSEHSLHEPREAQCIRNHLSEHSQVVSTCMPLQNKVHLSSLLAHSPCTVSTMWLHAFEIAEEAEISMDLRQVCDLLWEIRRTERKGTPTTKILNVNVYFSRVQGGSLWHATVSVWRAGTCNCASQLPSL